jgi:hypothetical protein
MTYLFEKTSDYRPRGEETYMIKYKIYLDDQHKHTSYSQIQDEYLNIQEGTNVDIKIKQDIRFYKDSTLLTDGKECRIEVLVNNNPYKTFYLKGSKNDKRD